MRQSIPMSGDFSGSLVNGSRSNINAMAFILIDSVKKFGSSMLYLQELRTFVLGVVNNTCQY